MTKNPCFNAANVLVVGDLMLDRYWYGDTRRVSPEAPVPVVQINVNDERPGGAGNVALGVQALGAKVVLLGVIGDDEAAQRLLHCLDKADIESKIQQQAAVKTIQKLRVVSHAQQIVRLDFEENYTVLDKTYLMNAYSSYLATANVVLLSDYDKGTLNQPQQLITAAQNAHIPVLIDPKGSDFSSYQNATLLTPNKKEFERVVGACANDTVLSERGYQLLEQHHWQAILVTKGAQGMTLLQREQPAIHLPAEAREVYDVTGAGDTVIAVVAAALGVGSELSDAVRLANIAAGLAVEHIGAVSISLQTLTDKLNRTHCKRAVWFDITQVNYQIRQARSVHERIIMAYGCFDVLHAKHMDYLYQARAQGDRLLVAVYVDPVAGDILGEGRPIHCLDERMELLANLEGVDWVVPLQQRDPQQLVATLCPDHVVVPLNRK